MQKWRTGVELLVLLPPKVVKNLHDARLVEQEFIAKLDCIYEQSESGEVKK
ncbi:MAG: hypothetical protein V7682_06295 [Cycloclasticus sp.]